MAGSRGGWSPSKKPPEDTAFAADERCTWQVEREIVLSRTMNLCVTVWKSWSVAVPCYGDHLRLRHKDVLNRGQLVLKHYF